MIGMNEHAKSEISQYDVNRINFIAKKLSCKLGQKVTKGRKCSKINGSRAILQNDDVFVTQCHNIVAKDRQSAILRDQSLTIFTIWIMIVGMTAQSAMSAMCGVSRTATEKRLRPTPVNAVKAIRRRPRPNAPRL